jgi:hypothetical protein
MRVAVIDEELIGPDNRVTVVARFDTVAEAEAYIDAQMKVNPSKVIRGGYGIDAPEDMANPG